MAASLLLFLLLLSFFHSGRDLTDAARDDETFVEMNLEIESDINPSELQKTAAEGTAGKPCFGKFREESATTNEDVAAPATDHGNFIQAIFRVYR